MEAEVELFQLPHLSPNSRQFLKISWKYYLKTTLTLTVFGWTVLVGRSRKLIGNLVEVDVRGLDQVKQFRG